jgi:hypothetical protein
MAEFAKAARLRADKFTTAEQSLQVWIAVADAGTAPEALLDPAYWAHCAQSVRWSEDQARKAKRPFLAEIKAYAEDGTWRMELKITRSGPGEVFVKQLSLTMLDAAAESEAAGYIVKWRSPSAKWGVVRPSDGTVLKDGFADKGEAAAWMTTHLQAAA